MRGKLNENPVAQIALLGVLAIVVGYLVLSKMGGGEEGAGSGGPVTSVESAPTETTASTGGESSVEVAGTAPVIAAATSSVTAPASRPLPHKVDAAYKNNRIVVVLLVRDGGVDDHIVRRATTMLEGNSRVAFFSAKAKHVARFAALAGPLGVNRVPALIVVRPKHLNGAGPAPASVTYGLNSKAGIRQTIREAVYKGPHLTYAPQ
ncbi:MAG TPA: hypothetical protein VGH14_20320 [Solirubrobacterales bacterium]|jgi:hypothetical protein